MKLFLQKNAKFSSAGGAAPRPPCLRRLGGLPPDPHWPPAAGGSATHREFLATRLALAIDKTFCTTQLCTKQD